MDAGDIHSALLTAGLPVLGVSVTAGQPVVTYTRALTGPEQATADSILATPPDVIALQALRIKAKVIFASTKNELAAVLRAVVLALVDEVNVLRTRLRSQDAVVAGATTLAALKAGWAALNAMPDRTPVQAKAAVNAKLDSGAAD